MFCSLQLRSQGDNFIHVDVILEHNPFKWKQQTIYDSLKFKKQTNNIFEKYIEEDTQF